MGAGVLIINDMFKKGTNTVGWQHIVLEQRRLIKLIDTNLI